MYAFDNVDNSGRPLTVSMLQGSEVDTVVYITGPVSYQTRQHVYTAVSRAKQRVIIVTCQSDLNAAIKEEPEPRNSSLLEKMREILYHTRVSNGISSYVLQRGFSQLQARLAPPDSCGMFCGLRDIMISFHVESMFCFTVMFVLHTINY